MHFTIKFHHLQGWRVGQAGLKKCSMESPRMDGLNVLGLIGIGGCGRVFLAETASGELRAVKVLEAISINRPLLAKMRLRLEAAGWPEGVMPLLSAEMDRVPSCWVVPLAADPADGGELSLRSLQHRLEEHPGDATWQLVQSLAGALAGMHRCHVAHGNLKPGNVFFGDEGNVQLADWGLGNMPGIGRLEFTDAVLYQPPEQLRNPEGYFDEAGYRWDVFAFGVLAFRILTGRFPRCQESFKWVAPEPGEIRRDGIQADLSKIAANLEAAPGPAWTDPPANELERRLRHWIDRCLALDPAHRPGTMVEVVAGFDASIVEVEAEAERDLLMDQRRHAEQRAWRTFFAAGLATAAAVVLAALWQLTASQRKADRQAAAAEIHSLREESKLANDSAEAARSEAAVATHALEYEKQLALARLESSRLIGDRLFEWAMEKGHRRLPPLDGRELRLQNLDRYFTDFLARTENYEALADERARVRLQLAEISLAAGDPVAARRRLSEAIEVWSGLPTDAALNFRIATNSLLLALLHQSEGDPETAEAFASARVALENVPQTEVDADRLTQLLAVLDFHEAKLLAARGEDGRALEQLMRATQALNRLVDQRPDAAVLRSELAGCYLSSATILDGIGKPGDAREVRSLAAVELTKLLEKSPEDPRLRLELAGCYGAMAEAAVLSGDITMAAALSKDALEILDGLLAEQPENVDAVVRKAAQLGLRAGILRDRGQAGAALKDFDEGIRILEGVKASSPGDATVSFRLATLWWQKGRMLGIGGDRDGEITQLNRARDLFATLEAERPPAGPRPEVLQRSGAYLLGDLGHALQLANREDDAAEVFADAVNLWDGLSRSRPQSEEYDEGLAWCRQRLRELQ